MPIVTIDTAPHISVAQKILARNEHTFFFEIATNILVQTNSDKLKLPF